MDPKELDMLVAGASTRCWVGQAGNSDCCIGGGVVKAMIETGTLTEREGRFIIEELQRPLTKEEKKVREPQRVLESLEPEEPKARPELVPPLISLLLRVYFDAKKRGEEETARKVIEGLDFLGILDRSK
ncbi:MAG: hypothetical protein HXS46_12045 [Theionarchaea archaeon]|nr:hypothetical protein [Theionarchaea archaeon]